MNTYFTPGPAQLFPTFERHLKDFVEKQLGSVSHRSGVYRDLHRHTVEQLRELLRIPESHQVCFLGSASETWERILLNCVEHESFHLVNGSFSRKFYDYALALHKHATCFEKPLGEGFAFREITVPEYAEVIAVVHNETSSGVQMPVTDIHRLAKAHPGKLVAVDMVSSAPYPDLDFGLIDMAYFSVQKAFGLPAGLGVWIVSHRCLEKAESLRNKPGITIGGHHDLPTLWKNALHSETPATPNVMGIYLLGKVAEDFNRTGISKVREETEAKAGMLYSFLDKNPEFGIFVKDARLRSQTVIVADTVRPAAEIIGKIKEKGLIIGSGYGANKAGQIRIANFPAVSTEQTARLIGALKNI